MHRRGFKRRPGRATVPRDRGPNRRAARRGTDPRHQPGELDELVARACWCARPTSATASMHAAALRVLAEQLEAGQVDEHVREQVGAVEQHARELRHDLAGALDPRRRQQRERAVQPAGREHRLVVVGRAGRWLSCGEPGVAHVRVDHGDRRAGQIAQREAELDEHAAAPRPGRRPGRSRRRGAARRGCAARSCAQAARSSPVAGSSMAIPSDGEDRVVVHARLARRLASLASAHGSSIACAGTTARGSRLRVVDRPRAVVVRRRRPGARRARPRDRPARARARRVGVISLAPPPDGAMADEFARRGHRGRPRRQAAAASISRSSRGSRASCGGAAPTSCTPTTRCR